MSEWKRNDPRWLIHSPAELAGEFIKFAERRRAARGVTFGIPAVDQRVIPMAGGDYIGVIARPGHGKTSLLAALALREARRIQRDGSNEIVVVVTWEQMAEEFEMLMASTIEGISSSDIAWGRVDTETLKRWAVARPELPIWTIGYGAARVGNMPRMTLSTILETLERINDEFNVRPALITMDYLQLIPSEHGAGDRVAQVIEASVRIKELALRIDCPVVVGIQARREVDDRLDKIPTMRDGQWSSNIEQDTDKLFALCRPERYRDPRLGEQQFIEFGARRILITPDLCFLRLLKQRFESGQYTWVLSFAPQLLRLAEMELNIPDFGGE